MADIIRATLALYKRAGLETIRSFARGWTIAGVLLVFAVAMQLAKRLVYRGLDASWHEAFKEAGQAMATSQSTEDAREGPRTFVEARPPKFQGR